MAMKKESGGKKPVAKMAVKGQSGRKTPAQQKAAQVQKAIKSVQKRAGVTAREARDIVTEIGTIVDFGTQNAVNRLGSKIDPYHWQSVDKKERLAARRNPKNPQARAGLKSLGKQIKEVGTAAKTGKPGTTPARTKAMVGLYDNARDAARRENINTYKSYDESYGNKQRGLKKSIAGPGAKMQKRSAGKSNLKAAPKGKSSTGR